jgi:diguanylate cyclase (GGDEF)-like protein
MRPFCPSLVTIHARTTTHLHRPEAAMDADEQTPTPQRSGRFGRVTRRAAALRAVALGRFRTATLAALALALLLGTLATGIVLSRAQSRAYLQGAFKLRGTSSATFVATFLAQQSGHDRLAGSAVLEAFVAHTVPYREHEVYLLDGKGYLLAASPQTIAFTLAAVEPALAHALAHASFGPVAGAATPTTFTAARVPGTSWRLVIAVPNSRLYASIGRWSAVIPWLVFALVSILGVALVALFVRLDALSRKMAETARTDALTGLLNRRAVSEHLTRAAAHARRRREPLSVLMIDLDHFKEVNDRHGHAAGDRVLRAFAECLRGTVRTEEVCGRWGGDEFVVLPPCGDERDAGVLATRLQAAASRAELGDVGLPAGVELSVGAATAVFTTPDELIQAADVALYDAKAARGDADLAAVYDERD